MATTAPFIFLSYSSADAERAQQITDYLEARDVAIWIAPRDVRAGLDYAEQLYQAIEACRAFMVIISPDANVSAFIRAETEMAFSLGKQIFPVRIANIEPGPGLALFLRTKHWVDLYGSGMERALDGLARDLRGDGGARPEPVCVHDVDVHADDKLPTELVQLAVQTKVAFYRHAWARMDRKSTRLSWNWAAFFAGVWAPAVWPAYRKMWGLAFAAFLVDFIVTITEPEALSPRLDLVLGAWVWISIGALFGVFGNGIYQSHIESLIEQAQQVANTRHELAQRGGVSWMGAAIFVLADAAMFALQSYGWLKAH